MMNYVMLQGLSLILQENLAKSSAEPAVWIPTTCICQLTAH